GGAGSVGDGDAVGGVRVIAGEVEELDGAAAAGAEGVELAAPGEESAGGRRDARVVRQLVGREPALDEDRDARLSFGVVADGDGGAVRPRAHGEDVLQRAALAHVAEDA